MTSPDREHRVDRSWQPTRALALDDLLDELGQRAGAAQQAQRQMTSLLDAVVAVSSDLDLPVVLSSIVTSACELVGARYGALGVIGPEGERLVEFVTHGLTDEERTRIGDPPHGAGVLGLLIRDPRPRRLKDISAHPDSYGFPPNHPPMHSFLGAPIAIRDMVFGNLYMAEKIGAAEFTDGDESTLVALAAAAGIAIDNARLYDRAQRQGHLSDAVGEIVQCLLGGGDLDEALQIMVDRVSELTGADHALVALVDRQGDLVLHAASRQVPVDALGRPLGAGRWSSILQAREPLLLLSHAGERTSPEASTLQHLAGADPAGSLALVPMIVGEVELGLLAVSWDVGADVTATESLDALSNYARSTGLALEAASGQHDRGRMELLEDRDRIARDMHDHVIQRLFATGLSLQSAWRLTSDPRVADRLAAAVDELDSAIKDIRQTIFALHRPLGGPGVEAEIREVVDTASDALGFVPQVEFGVALPELPETLAPEVLAVVRESLANVARHARAGWCRVQVDVGELAQVVVEDDGVGIADQVARSGLVNLGRRAERLHGSLRVTPREPRGTQVLWQVPLV